jgi:uncharacterized protein YndB with AHSA1/START domain
MTVESADEGTAGPVDILVHVEASCPRTWRSFTDADELTAWYWPSRLQPSAALDVRVGGDYRISAAAPPMAVHGRYLELESPRRAVMTWRWDGEDTTSTVALTLDPAGAGTDVRVIHDGLPAEDKAAHLQGWADCLGRLSAHLAVGG